MPVAKFPNMVSPPWARWSLPHRSRVRNGAVSGARPAHPRAHKSTDEAAQLSSRSTTGRSRHRPTAPIQAQQSLSRGPQTTCVQNRAVTDVSRRIDILPGSQRKHDYDNGNHNGDRAEKEPRPDQPRAHTARDPLDHSEHDALQRQPAKHKRSREQKRTTALQWSVEAAPRASCRQTESHSSSPSSRIQAGSPACTADLS